MTCSMSLSLPAVGAAAIARRSASGNAPVASPAVAAAPTLRTSRREGRTNILLSRDFVECTHDPTPGVVGGCLPLWGAEETVGGAVVDLELGGSTGRPQLLLHLPDVGQRDAVVAATIGADHTGGDLRRLLQWRVRLVAAGT